MWETIEFKSLGQQNAWIAANEHKSQITVLFINNGYAVEYKRNIRS